MTLTSEQNQPIDVLIRRALIVDGSEDARPYSADVGIQGGKIGWIRPDCADASGTAGTASQARLVIDAEGLVLAPGFIDMHAHADLSLITGADSEAKLRQGVTTQVIGQDGLGYAPINDEVFPLIAKQIAGWNGPVPSGSQWRSMEQYLAVLDAGSATNAIVLTPHGNLRMMVMGNQARIATDAEIAEMCVLLEESMAQGSAGLSTGLTYTPAMYADSRELVALCEVVASRGGYFSPHTRSYGAGALDAYAEMIEVARLSGVHLHLTHATMNFPQNLGRAKDMLDLIGGARNDGIAVSIDTYPYTAGSTTLSALLPSWAFEGGPASLLRRLGDPIQRSRMLHALDVSGSDGAHGTVVDWDAQQIAGVGDPNLEPVVGMTVEAIHRSGALERLCGSGATTAAETALDLLLADGLATTILMHVGHEQNIETTITDPMHCAGSDGITHGTSPHPRGWGTFARYLGEYSRRRGLMSLTQVVAHMTGRPARVLGLHNRGFIRSGFVADLVLFDPDQIQDHATYESPKLPATGLELVLLSGHVVVSKDRLVREDAGTALRAGTDLGHG